jgi:hypothetical protein
MYLITHQSTLGVLQLSHGRPSKVVSCLVRKLQIGENGTIHLGASTCLRSESQLQKKQGRPRCVSQENSSGFSTSAQENASFPSMPFT